MTHMLVVRGDDRLGYLFIVETESRHASVKAQGVSILVK